MRARIAKGPAKVQYGRRRPISTSRDTRDSSSADSRRMWKPAVAIHLKFRGNSGDSVSRFRIPIIGAMGRVWWWGGVPAALPRQKGHVGTEPPDRYG